MDTQLCSHPERVQTVTTVVLLILNKLCGFICTGLYRAHGQAHQGHVPLSLLLTVNKPSCRSLHLVVICHFLAR